MEPKYRKFWDAVEAAGNVADRNALAQLAMDQGMPWGEVADMSTRYDGALRSTRYLDNCAAFLRQLRNEGREQFLTARLTPVRVEVNGRWREGYKVTSPNGRELQPYMTKSAARAFCRAQGWTATLNPGA